jgi:PhnB protein
MRVNPYLYYNGDCEAAFKFYESAIGGRIVAMMPYEGSPVVADTPAEWRSKIMHGRMEIAGNVLMGGDAPPGRFVPQAGFSVSLNIDDPAEAERVYAALSEGGSVHMTLQETFWAERFAMFADKFGIPWMINCEKTG